MNLLILYNKILFIKILFNGFESKTFYIFLVIIYKRKFDEIWQDLFLENIPKENKNELWMNLEKIVINLKY